jgi:nitrogen-specific signal transduction histidine kinase
MRDQASQPLSILCVNTDITEKKQLQAQFLHAQRLESLGTLASGIAHDLNNTLTPIISSVQLLPLKFPQPNPEYQRLVTVIEHNCLRAAELVKQILTFSGCSQSRSIALQIEPLLLEIEQFAHSTFPKSIEITKIVPKQELWPIQADPTHIHQILINLCVNARDAMPSGGTLEISASNFLADDNFARMKLDARVGPYVVIQVKDTGFGIPPLILERIFEPFFTTKESSKGTGLGLSTVIGLLKTYSGFILVETEVGKGSQFQVYLPAVDHSISQIDPPSVLPYGNGQLILVVDDEASIVEITKTSLQDFNYRVLTASNGMDALSLFTDYKNQIDMVLIDLILPDINGPTVIGIMQRLKPQIKILAISGSANNPMLASAELCVHSFLRKPYTLHELLSALAALVA